MTYQTTVFRQHRAKVTEVKMGRFLTTIQSQWNLHYMENLNWPIFTNVRCSTFSVLICVFILGNFDPPSAKSSFICLLSSFLEHPYFIASKMPG